MIKSIDEIRIKDFDRMKRTGKVSQFKKSWNILPSILFIKRFIKLKDELLSLISDNHLDDDLDMIEYKCESAIRITQLEVLFNIIQKWLILDVKIKLILNKIKLPRRLRRKIKDGDITQLGKAIELIEQLTNIKIDENKSTPDILNELYSHIEYEKAKYNELFNKKEDETTEQKKDLYLIDYASVYASYMGNEINGLSEMTFPELIALKKRADERIRSQQSHNINPENIE